MRHNSKSLCILQYDECSIQLLKAIPSHSGVEIQECIVETGNWMYSDGSMSRALIRFSEEHDLSRSQVYAVFPRHDVAVRINELPSQDEAEVSGMVELMAGEMLPLPLEELVVSSSILDTLEGGHSRVLIAAARKSTVEEYLELLRIAGIEPVQLLLSTRCLLAAAEYPHSLPEPDVLLLECTGTSVECIGLHEGQLVYSRSATWQDSSPDMLLEKVEKIMTAFQRESLGVASDLNVYVSSPGEPVNALASRLETHLGLSCRSAIPVLRGVRNGVEVLADTIPATLLGGVLLAQEDVSPALNLLPSNVLEARQRDSTQTRVLRIGAGILSVLILSTVLYFQAIGSREDYLETLEMQADELRPAARAIVIKRNHLQRLQQRVEQKNTVYEYFGNIAGQMPDKGINLTRFSYRIDDGITLQGRADRIGRFDSFIDNLRSLGRSVYPQLAQAQEMYRTLRKERGKDVWDYSISIPFPEENEEGEEE
ncbi:MAG: hypothetical protein COA73_06405 [Candidatus Hydrogenedentota bacterium]|nr:MAG: hypothetical protein COA73_06405 [Candidatus Hydrogenedentota bacterium]